MHLADSEDDEPVLIIKFSNKKVTIDESKNKVYIFNEEDPPKQSKYAFLFRRK
jgi:hypothetical protein